MSEAGKIICCRSLDEDECNAELDQKRYKMTGNTVKTEKTEVETSNESPLVLAVCLLLAVILFLCFIYICCCDRKKKYKTEDGQKQTKINTVNISNVSLTDSKLVESSGYTSESDAEVAQLREEQRILRNFR